MAGTQGPEVSDILPGQNWEFLLTKTILYAAGHINRWYWRGSLGGVLPCGFDAASIAAEAIAEFLQDSAQQSLLKHLTTEEVQRDLERRVRRHVNRLHHRSENRLLRNEPDLALVTLDGGEAVSVIELVPDPSPRPDKALIEKESGTRFHQFKLRFSAFLRGDRPVLRLFNLFCDDRSKLGELASSLKLHPGTVKNLRRRFRRKWAQFHGRFFPGNDPPTSKNL